MSQHFLPSAKARTLSLSAVLRMTDEEAESVFRNLRWTDGKPMCPHCECPTVYECRRPSGALRFRCKACRKNFSITSGTLFAFHKMPLRQYLAATAIFCNEVKGKSALALSRDLDVQYKTAFVLAHKIREAMAGELKGMKVGGTAKIVEVDGGYFGGCVKPANEKENRRDRRLAQNQTGKRQVVVVARERDGRTLPMVFKSESAALGFLALRIANGTHLMADEAASWNDLHGRFPVSRIDHSKLYSDRSGVYTNGAEEFFSRMRRAEIGHTITSRAPIWSATLRKAPGAGITAGWTTRGRSGPYPDWPWPRRPRLTGAGIDSGHRKRPENSKGAVVAPRNNC